MFSIRTSPGRFEQHVDDVTLRRRDDDALHPLLALELADVRSDDLYPGVAERHVEGARVGHVGEKEANDLAALHIDGVVGGAVDQHDVAEATHQGVGRRAGTEGHQPVVVDQNVIERDHLFAMRRSVVVGVRRRHHDVSVQTEVLLDVLTHMWVVPVDSGVSEVHLVAKALARPDGRLGDVRNAIEAVVETQAMPVHGGRHVDVIGEVDDDRRAPRGADQRPGVLAVVAEHHVHLAADAAPHERRPQVDLVAVLEIEHFVGPRYRKHLGVHPDARQIGIVGRHSHLEAGHHRHVTHRRHAPGAGLDRTHHVAHRLHLVGSTLLLLTLLLRGRRRLVGAPRREQSRQPKQQRHEESDHYGLVFCIRNPLHL